MFFVVMGWWNIRMDFWAAWLRISPNAKAVSETVRPSVVLRTNWLALADVRNTWPHKKNARVCVCVHSLREINICTLFLQMHDASPGWGSWARREEPQACERHVRCRAAWGDLTGPKELRQKNTKYISCSFGLLYIYSGLCYSIKTLLMKYGRGDLERFIYIWPSKQTPM